MSRDSKVRRFASCYFSSSWR